MSTGGARYANGYQPQCIPCFEKAIGPDRARFAIRQAMQTYYQAHDAGCCPAGICPVIGCHNGPAEIN